MDGVFRKMLEAAASLQETVVVSRKRLVQENWRP